MTSLLLCCMLAGQATPVATADGPAIAEIPGETILDLSTAAGLRAGYRDVMRRSANRVPDDLLEVAADLVTVYTALDQSRVIASGESFRMRQALKPRLELTRERLMKSVRQDREQARRDAARRSKSPRVEPTDEARLDATLAGGNAVAASAQQLIDLITATIAPESWEVNGGNGRIMFFRPLNVLVIRNSSEVHEQIGGTLQQLRK
ncbi:MAG: hypothetical protein IT428_12365 [Planctomycetaceae bacterium]|nr:hypothetical protein [Planctomycetaceae bacterium]